MAVGYLTSPGESLFGVLLITVEGPRIVPSLSCGYRGIPLGKLVEIQTLIPQAG